MYDEGHRSGAAGTDANDNATTTTEAPELAGSPVLVRRNAGVAAAIGAVASAVAIAYLWRAVQGGSPLDWALCGVIALLAGFHLGALIDARTPLVVADDLGVRIRLGQQWRGLPWDAVALVEVRPRSRLLGDGRLVFRPHNVDRALDGLDAAARRAAKVNERLHGAPLAVPLGLTTRASGRGPALADELAALARGRATVELTAPQTTGTGSDADETPTTDELPDAGPAPDTTPDTVPDAVAQPVGASDQADDADTTASAVPPRGHRRSLVGGLGTIVSRVAKGRGHDVDVTTPATAEAQEDPSPQPSEDDPAAEPLPHAPLAVPLREARRGLRAQVTREQPATTLGAAALHDDAGDARTGTPEGRGLRRPGRVDLVFESVHTATVRPISQLGDPVEPLVIDDFVTEPAADPVIGPQLAAARTRVGLSVDELAERTRIRPHVIESIEVDDFAPCGGDFYARGHLRTLARVLGQDPVPLLEKFDNRYATAPINARRVFEAELATGAGGPIRSTVGGPNWALLVGIVLSLVLVWGVVRLFATETPSPDEGLLPTPAPALNGSAGVDRGFPGAGGAAATPRKLPVTLVATQAGSRVVVRQRGGKVVYAGDMVLGERKALRVVPPVRVRAGNAGAIEVRVKGRDRGPVGDLGSPGRRTFHRPS